MPHAFYCNPTSTIWDALNNFNLQAMTYWCEDTHGNTFMAETSSGVSSSGFRIYSLINSTNFTTASEPYSVFFKWHLWETFNTTNITEVKLTAEELE